jgi:hypothetical protein
MAARLHPDSQTLAFRMVILGLVRLLSHGNPDHEAPEKNIFC